MNSKIDFFYYAFRNVLFVSVPLVIISTIILSLPHSSATGSSSGVDQIQFSLSVSCTLSSVVDSAHTKEITNGTYHSDVGKTTITTLCNDGNGYSVYAVGYSNNEEGNNRLVNTESSNFSIVSGTAESGNTSNWAMSLNNLKDDPSLTPPTITLDYDGIYGIVPDKWTKVASLPARATDMVRGSSFTTTYAVYTSSSQYAGTYNGQVKYMLVHPNNNKPTLSDIELAFASHGIQPIYRDEDNKYYFAMQDMTTDICSSVSGDGETTATQLVDIRDNKLYWVTKLKDGHCWMTQNLDTDINPSISFNSNNTDLNVAYDSSTGQYAEYNDGYTESNGVIYYTPASSATTINFQNNGPISGWQDNNTAPYSANKTDSTETGHASLGNYYNWTAAIASNDSTNIRTTNAMANNSICPNGWRLPNISSNEFGELLYAYNIIKSKTGSPAQYQANGFENISKLPLWFNFPGFIDGSSLRYFNERSVYWSSIVANNSANAFNLHINANGIWPKNMDPYSIGISVRCVAK